MNITDPWDIVEEFESKVANYAGSKYAVSTDNCTNALFLCLKYYNNPQNITIPKNTYISVPQAIIHAGYNLKFEDLKWSGMYQLKPFNIWDGSVRFKQNMYKGGLHCLSFHHRKPIGIGKGGMILTDDIEFRDWARVVRYEGRTYRVKYEDDVPKMVGWNMYMYPEQAEVGLELFEKYIEPDWKWEAFDDVGGSDSYTDLSKLEIFKEK